MSERTFIETLHEDREELINYPFDVTQTFPSTPIEELERLLDPNILYDITEKKAPHYSMRERKIHMPDRKHYFCEYAFYCAALHEMAHSTRDTSVRRNLPYPQEEVVAQMTAMKIMKEYRDVVWWNLDCSYLRNYLQQATVEYNRRTGSTVSIEQMRDACAVIANDVVKAIRKRR